jgi:hypothetical protein
MALIPKVQSDEWISLASVVFPDPERPVIQNTRPLILSSIVVFSIIFF